MVVNPPRIIEVQMLPKDGAKRLSTSQVSREIAEDYRLLAADARGKTGDLRTKKGGNPKPPSADVLRKARDIVEESGANSQERFNRIVLGETTFRDQAKTYLQWIQTRDRKPIKDPSSIEAALNKWILPEIGDLPLGDVHNITVKPLVDRMKGSLSARTVNKYVEYVGQVVASLKDGRTGEPIHPRKWDSSVMDLPVVNPKRQRRPALRLEAINTLVSKSNGDEQALYILHAATGMRISEALALETKHFVNDGRTIQVFQQWTGTDPASSNVSRRMLGRERLTYRSKSQSTCERL